MMGECWPSRSDESSCEQVIGDVGRFIRGTGSVAATCHTRSCGRECAGSRSYDECSDSILMMSSHSPSHAFFASCLAMSNAVEPAGKVCRVSKNVGIVTSAVVCACGCEEGEYMIQLRGAQCTYVDASGEQCLDPKSVVVGHGCHERCLSILWKCEPE